MSSQRSLAPVALAFLAVITVFLCAPAASAQTELISNGTFNANLAGWTLGGFGAPFQFTNSGYTFTSPGYAVSNPAGPGIAVMSQTFTAPSAFDTLNLSYDLIAFASGPPPVATVPASSLPAPGQAYVGGGTFGLHNYGRVQLLSGSPGLVDVPAVATFHLGSGGTGGTAAQAYTTYAFDLTNVVTPGQQYTLRFDNVAFARPLVMGVDNVHLVAAPFAAAPTDGYVWTGANSSDWADGGNWTAVGSAVSGVPDRNVFGPVDAYVGNGAPAGTTSVSVGAGAVDSLTIQPRHEVAVTSSLFVTSFIEARGTLRLVDATLDLGGNIALGGGGTVTMETASSAIRGLAGASSTNLQVAAGTTIDAQAGTIGSADPDQSFSLSNAGRVTSSGALDVIVHDPNSGAQSRNETAGTIEARGTGRVRILGAGANAELVNLGVLQSGGPYEAGAAELVLQDVTVRQPPLPFGSLRAGEIRVNAGGDHKLTVAGNVAIFGGTIANYGTVNVDGTLALTGPLTTFYNFGQINLTGATSALSISPGTFLAKGDLAMAGGLLDVSGFASLASCTVTGGSIHVGSAGTLEIGTANFSAGAVAVDTGGRLKILTTRFSGTSVVGGSGTVEGNVAVGAGGTLSPGNSPGTLTVEGDATWEDGGIYLWEISDADGVAGADWDMLVATGALDVTATGGDPFLIRVASDGLGNFDSLNDYSWRIASASSITGLDAGDFAFDTSLFLLPYNGTFSIEQSGDDVNLLFTSAGLAPEPAGAAALFALAAWAGAGRRRARVCPARR